jgi:hypothetical protein
MIHAATAEVARLIELLGLDSPQFTEFRMLWLGILALAEHMRWQRLLVQPCAG